MVDRDGQKIECTGIIPGEAGGKLGGGPNLEIVEDDDRAGLRMAQGKDEAAEGARS